MYAHPGYCSRIGEVAGTDRMEGVGPVGSAWLFEDDVDRPVKSCRVALDGMVLGPARDVLFADCWAIAFSLLSLA